LRSKPLFFVVRLPFEREKKEREKGPSQKKKKGNVLDADRSFFTFKAKKGGKKGAFKNCTSQI